MKDCWFEFQSILIIGNDCIYSQEGESEGCIDWRFQRLNPKGNRKGYWKGKRSQTRGWEDSCGEKQLDQFSSQFPLCKRWSLDDDKSRGNVREKEKGHNQEKGWRKARRESTPFTTPTTMTTAMVTLLLCHDESRWWWRPMTTLMTYQLTKNGWQTYYGGVSVLSTASTCIMWLGQRPFRSL